MKTKKIIIVLFFFFSILLIYSIFQHTLCYKIRTYKLKKDNRIINVTIYKFVNKYYGIRVDGKNIEYPYFIILDTKNRRVFIPNGPKFSYRKSLFFWRKDVLPGVEYDGVKTEGMGFYWDDHYIIFNYISDNMDGIKVSNRVFK